MQNHTSLGWGGLLEPDGTLVEANETALEFGGIERDDVIGKKMWEATWFEHSQETRERARKAVKRAADGEFVRHELPIKGDDREVIIDFSVRPVTNDDGEVTVLIPEGRDITARKERERELQQYEAYLEESSDIITVLDDTGTITYQSPAVKRILGYDREEFIGQNGFDYIHPDDVDEVWETFTDLVAEPGATVTVECRFRTVDDEWRWLEVRGTNRLEHDPINGIVTNNRDITERKEREQEFKQTSRQLKAVLDTVEAAIFIKDTDGRYQLMNQECRRLLGADPDEDIAGLSDHDFLPEDTATQYRADDQRVIETGETIELEEEVPTPEGVQINRTLKSPFYNDDDELIGICAVSTDITEQKQREQQLKHYEGLIETLPIGYVRTSFDDEFLDMNSTFVEMLDGSTKEDVRSHAVSQFYRDSTTRDQLLATLREEGKVDGEELKVTTLSDDTIWITVTGRVVGDDDGKPYIDALVQDVTERKEGERELQRKNERLEEFASIVSHDLRNPLNVAEGRLALVAEECDSDHLEHVDQALDRMDALIEDLLTLAYEGESITDLESIDLAVIAEGCWATVETGEATLVTTTDRTVYADESRLKQLFENLVRNAVEHGGDNVTVTIGEVDDGFYIEDDGSGIPETEREAVFDAGYSTSDEGTGFGLNIVKQVAEAHNWEISVTDGSEGGARFEFTGVNIVDE